MEMTIQQRAELIKQRLPKTELHLQLAEEVDELVVAALEIGGNAGELGNEFNELAKKATRMGKAVMKVKRATDGINPTPISEETAWENLAEEIADVMICIELIEPDFPFDLEEKVIGIINQKTDRWVKRLKTREQDCT